MAHSPEGEPPARLPAPRTRWRAIAAGLGFTALVFAVLWHPPRTLVILEGRIYDSFLRQAPHRPAGTVPVVVDIDEESLRRYGQWPWPRYRVAQLLGRLRELGASAVALDIVFAEPDRTSLPLIAREIERDLGVVVDLGEPTGRDADNDRRLAEVLEDGPFVLGYAFDFESGSDEPPDECVLHPLALDPADRGSGARLARAPRAVCNLPQLARAAGASGFFNVAPDPDGTVRSVPLLIEHRGEVYPSLALAALVRAGGAGAVALGGSTGGGGRLTVAGREIPFDSAGNMLVRFRGAGRGYRYLSAADVLKGRVPAAALSGRIAFVGTTAAGLKELRATPFDPAFPGPEVHAAALDTMLQGDFLQRPSAAHAWGLLAGLLAGALASFVLARSGAIAGLPLLLLGSASLWGGSFWLFSREGLFISPLIPQAVLAGVFALLSFLRFRQGEREAAAFYRRLSATQDAIIMGMAALAETRDSVTGGHIQRTRHYVKLLALLLRNHPRFRGVLDDQTIELMYRLAPMHDIGKVGIRDQILLKPALLTLQEFEEMKFHTVFGDNTLRIAENGLGEDSFLRIGREFALTHQEKWDGTGYPQGLKGDQIPVSGRLMAVADVYDALVSRRKYKEPLSHEQATAILAEGRGTHFDPDVLDAFLANQDRFKEIASRFADTPGHGNPPGERSTPENPVVKSSRAPGDLPKSGRSAIVGALILGLTALLSVEARAADGTFAGVGLFVGAQYHDTPIWDVTERLDWQEVQARLLVGEHVTGRGDLWFEVTVGSITWDQDIPNSLEIGVTAMTSYDFYEQRGRSLYGELGAGFGWLTNNPDAAMVYPGALGLIDYGVGAKATMKSGLTFKLGLRFHHRSAMMRDDSGMNSYGLMFSVTK